VFLFSAETIYGLSKKIRKTSLFLKEKQFRTQRFFSDETFVIMECVQNHGHEIPFDDHTIKPHIKVIVQAAKKYVFYTRIYLQL
jgi:hypothetical protein